MVRLVAVSLRWRGMDRLLNVWDDPDRAVAFEADDGEIAAVGCKNGADGFPLGKVGQGGAAELYPKIGTT